MKRNAFVKFLIIRGQNNYFTGFNFLGKTIKKFVENSITFEIENDIFKNTNNCVPCEIELFNENNDKKKFIIHIYMCENIFHLYLQELGFTYELIFSDEYEFKDLKNYKWGYEFDDNGNNHRIRISLINYNFAIIKLGSLKITPSSFCGDLTRNYDSFQLSLYSQEIIICKPSELYKPKKDFNTFFEKYNDLICELYNQLVDLLKSNKIEKNKLTSIEKKGVEINKEFNTFNLYISKTEWNQYSIMQNI